MKAKPQGGLYVFLCKLHWLLELCWCPSLEAAPAAMGLKLRVARSQPRAQGVHGPPPSPSVPVNHSTCGRCLAWLQVEAGAHLLHQQALQLSLTILHALAIGAIYHPDEAVRALKVVSPVGAQRLLATHIPDVQLESGKEGAMKVRLPLPSRPPPSPTMALSDPTHPRCSRVLMLKPSVGEMVSTSSPLNFLRMVVLPALSKPLEHTG